MKKILLALVLLGCMTACSNNGDDNISSINNVSAEPQIKPTEILNNKSNIISNDRNLDAHDVASLVPKGWHILEHRQPVKAEGDLNKDGIQDLAIVIERTQEENYNASRSLLIAFGNKDHTYSISIIAEKVILGALEGGGWGDPFDGISIDRGSVIVSDFGGSGQRWYHKYRFRYQDNDWYLIGATMGSNHSIKEGTEMVFDEEDYNLLTGDYNIVKTNEDGEEQIAKGNRGKKKLVKLSEFNIDDM